MSEKRSVRFGRRQGEHTWRYHGRMNPNDERVASIAAVLIGSRLIRVESRRNVWPYEKTVDYHVEHVSQWSYDEEGSWDFNAVLSALYKAPPEIRFIHYRFREEAELPDSGPTDWEHPELEWYPRANPPFKPHHRGGVTSCCITLKEPAKLFAPFAMFLGATRCSYSDHFEYAEGRLYAFDNALDQLEKFVAQEQLDWSFSKQLQNLPEGVVRREVVKWAHDKLEKAQREKIEDWVPAHLRDDVAWARAELKKAFDPAGREWADLSRDLLPEDVHVGADLARDEPSESKKVEFTLDEATNFPHEIFDEGLSIKLDDEVIERIREAAERDRAEGKLRDIYLLDGETEFGGKAYNALFGQFRELFNEYLMAAGLHPAEKEYMQNNPRIPEWLSDYVVLIADEHPARGLNYWPLEPRLKHVEKIEELVRENADLLGVDSFPAGKLWLELAYGLLQDLVEKKKAFVREGS